MSGDEILATIISGLIVLTQFVPWMIRALSPSSLLSSRITRWPLWIAPLASLALILAVLLTLAASDVRDDPKYLAMYTLIGGAWLAIAVRSFPLLGLHALDDVAQRRNPAASCLFIGALLGTAAAFAGGNIGEGPGWWVVVFSSGFATASLFLVWAVLNGARSATGQVVVDRDIGAGIRLGALLFALGLIFGRGAAGNWRGPINAAEDFLAIAAPALLILIPELAISWLFRPTPQRPTSPVAFAGIAPALIYLAGAGAYIYALGWWT